MTRSSRALKATPPVKEISAPETILRPQDLALPSSAAAGCDSGAAAALFFNMERTLRPTIVLRPSLSTWGRVWESGSVEKGSKEAGDIKVICSNERLVVKWPTIFNC